MGEVGEIWREFAPILKAESRAKKKNNHEKSLALLDELKIPYETKNGVHYMIETPSGRINFWPSTGLFSGAASGRGIFNLIKELEKGQNHD